MGKAQWFVAATALALTVPQAASGKVAGLRFRALIKNAEAIVEGEVVSQAEMPKPPGPDRPVHHTKESLVKVSKVHKGDVTVGQTIRVRSDSTFICDTSRLAASRKYVLILKGTGEVYTDLSHGQGTWWIMPLGGRQIAVNVGAVTTGGWPIDTFRSRLAWAMTDPLDRPTKPTLSKDQALKIARRTLAQGGVDLAAFKLKKAELLRIGSDLVGVAHKGDWMWMCDWQKPEAAGKNPRPMGAFVFCYVHARTGAVQSSFPGGLCPEDICRVFLKTYSPFRKHFDALAEKARFRTLTEAELRARAGRAVGRPFSKLRATYAPTTRFLLADFPEAADGRSVLFVLTPERTICYAAILPPGLAGKQRPAA